MIAYDFDGVIVNDIDFNPNLLNTILDLRTNNILPLFQPDGDYAIITGRPESDYADTLKFIQTRLRKQPKKLFHSCPDLNKGHEYKASILIENPEIKIYVESCPIQSQRILEAVSPHRKILVIHFAEMIKKLLKGKLHE